MNEVTFATCCISPTARWRTIAPFSFSSVCLDGHNGKELTALLLTALYSLLYSATLLVSVKCVLAFYSVANEFVSAAGEQLLGFFPCEREFRSSAST